MVNNQQPTGFKELLNAMMRRRWFITAMVLGGFMIIILGIFLAIMGKTPMSTEWKELLLLLLGAFIGSYGKIIDYWFSDTDKDKMLVQKMDEEDGTSLSNTADMKESAPLPSNQVSNQVSNEATSQVAPQVKVEIDEDGDGVMDGYDLDGDGDIDEYFPHRNCQHVWGDQDGDGDEECLICGLIKPLE
jgi:hypothetical protein